MTDDARYRIEALERFTELGSGFHVASLDMELRGAGDLLGVEQSGNVAAVGLDMFLHMLEEAVAELRGEPIVHDVDPEITVDLETFIPEGYIEDVGLRLSFYKRLASAGDEQAVHDIALELEDRFGPPPEEVRNLVRAMSLKPALRDLRIAGCEASATRIALHLRDDTPLDPAKVMELVKKPRSPYKLTPDMKLTRRFDDGKDAERSDAIDRVEEVLRELSPLRRASESQLTSSRS
jgi:transcription-repair coupling factor (superfamily II helicase)